MTATIDLFAGPGGWDYGVRPLGLDALGIEFEPWTCETRDAAGLQTLRADVTYLDPLQVAELNGGCELLIASPPCQAWSMAGIREGEHDRAEVYRLARELALGLPVTDHAWVDPRAALTAEPMRWIRALRPRYVAFEQVPPVIELWHYCAELLTKKLGYGCWTGHLCAERYGVPQTRRRAILMASLGELPHPPAPTHQAYVKGEPARGDMTLGGELAPWVSMAEALGWGMTERPSPTVPSAGSAGGGPRPLDGGSGARELVRREKREGRWLRVWTTERPSTTVAGDPRIPAPGHKKDGPYPDAPRRMEDAITVTVEEAAVLQGFPRGYPWRGSRTRQHEQIGNAVPPPLARAIIAALLPEGITDGSIRTESARG